MNERPVPVPYAPLAAVQKPFRAGSLIGTNPPKRWVSAGILLAYFQKDVLFSPPGNPWDSTWTHGIQGLTCGLHGLVIKINKL